MDHVPESYEEAMGVAKRNDKFPIGIIYRKKKPVFHQALYGDWNPVTKRLSRKQRIETIEAMLSS
jgi:hypothetical protein